LVGLLPAGRWLVRITWNALPFILPISSQQASTPTTLPHDNNACLCVVHVLQDAGGRRSCGCVACVWPRGQHSHRHTQGQRTRWRTPVQGESCGVLCCLPGRRYRQPKQGMQAVWGLGILFITCFAPVDVAAVLLIGSVLCWGKNRELHVICVLPCVRPRGQHSHRHTQGQRTRRRMPAQGRGFWLGILSA
jgi:hypothetical protein